MELFRCSNCYCLIINEDISCPYCGSNVKNQIENVRKIDKNFNNTFSLIVGIIILLITVISSTFTYFSVTTRSAENDVTTGSSYLMISYIGDTEIEATNSIPTSEVVETNEYKKFQSTIIEYISKLNEIIFNKN